MTSDEPVARRTDGPESAPAVRRSRGDRQREAIVNAVRELLEGRSFEELSVSAISERAGITRSGFYFYFESKYDVLALIFDEVTHELEELTHYFAPRGTDETPAAFATRMVGSAVAVYAHNDPIVTACNNARNTDTKIREILDRQLVSEALQHLSPAHQTVLVETFYRGGTMAAVARELGIPHGTARSRLHYALDALRQHLEEHDAIAC